MPPMNWLTIATMATNHQPRKAEREVIGLDIWLRRGLIKMVPKMAVERW